MSECGLGVIITKRAQNCIDTCLERQQLEEEHTPH